MLTTRKDAVQYVEDRLGPDGSPDNTQEET